MKCSLLLQPVGLLQLILNIFHIINIQGSKLDLGPFIKYIYNIDLSSYTYGLIICFKLAMMLDMPTPYSLIPV